MKKITSLLLIFTLIFSLSGCKSPVINKKSQSEFSFPTDSVKPPQGDNDFAFFTNENGYFYSNMGEKPELFILRALIWGLQAPLPTLITRMFLTPPIPIGLKNKADEREHRAGVYGYEPRFLQGALRF